LTTALLFLSWCPTAEISSSSSFLFKSSGVTDSFRYRIYRRRH
jgi:hypothetical protein